MTHPSPKVYRGPLLFFLPQPLQVPELTEMGFPHSLQLHFSRSLFRNTSIPILRISRIFWMGGLGHRRSVCVTGFLFYDIFAEPVSVFSSMPAQYYAASYGTEFRLVVIRPVAACTGPYFSLRISAETASRDRMEIISAVSISFPSVFQSHSFPWMPKEIKMAFDAVNDMPAGLNSLLKNRFSIPQHGSQILKLKETSKCSP